MWSNMAQTITDIGYSQTFPSLHLSTSDITSYTWCTLFSTQTTFLLNYINQFRIMSLYCCLSRVITIHNLPNSKIYRKDTNLRYKNTTKYFVCLIMMTFTVHTVCVILSETETFHFRCDMDVNNNNTSTWMLHENK